MNHLVGDGRVFRQIAEFADFRSQRCRVQEIRARRSTESLLVLLLQSGEYHANG